MLKQKILRKKIPDITNLATKTTLNAKINKVKSERASILTQLLNYSNAKIILMLMLMLTAVENEIPSVNNFVK